MLVDHLHLILEHFQRVYSQFFSVTYTQSMDYYCLVYLYIFYLVKYNYIILFKH